MTTQINPPRIPHTLDIYQHLKENIQNVDKNCHCIGSSDYIKYCIPCKMSICPKCHLSKHVNHSLIPKTQHSLTPQKADLIYNDILSVFSIDNPFSSIDDSRHQLISEVNRMTSTLIDQINQLQTNKINEINTLMDHLLETYIILKKNIENTKTNLQNYLSSHHTFFNNQGKNCDYANTIFLLNYDMINLAYCKKEQLKLVELSIRKDYQQYRQNLRTFITNTQLKTEEALFDMYNTDRMKLETLEHEKGIINEDEALQGHVKKFYPQLTIGINLEKLSNEDFSDINARISKYTQKISSIKRMIFATIQKTEGLKEIEKLLELYETNRQANVDMLFSQRKLNNGEKTEKSNKTLGTKAVSLSKAEKPTKASDVSLDFNPIVQKYFSYLMLEFYGNNFKLSVKDSIKLNGDIMTKPSEEEEDDASSSMKLLEDSNEIIYYDRSKGIMIKEKVPLAKNPYGYTKFPVGCRYISLGNKICITGGRDEQQQYPNVLIYDISKHVLKRLMDLNVPRSYHTMTFNETFNTLMVIGGEKCGSVEILDPLTCRWRVLPELNFPRANASFYFDHLRGLMFTMFGIEGPILNEQYTDAIEVLDLARINEGWKFLDIKNSEEYALKTYLMISPISNDKILIYGGWQKRGQVRVVCMYDIMKSQITKLDQKEIEELRAKAHIGKTLSRVLKKISLNCGGITLAPQKNSKSSLSKAY